jgi:hypothetical protein
MIKRVIKNSPWIALGNPGDFLLSGRSVHEPSSVFIFRQLKKPQLWT